jgi:hypothetical protein
MGWGAGDECPITSVHGQSLVSAGIDRAAVDSRMGTRSPAATVPGGEAVVGSQHRGKRRVSNFRSVLRD